MKFVYVGEEADTTAYGLTFKKGVAVEVTDAHAIKKLTSNGQFKAVADDDLSDVTAAPDRDGQVFFRRNAGRPKGK